MVRLIDDDIQNKDIRNWSGVHLFHFAMSSCSQKLRIYLNLKGIRWHPHVIDLTRQENCCPWFLGINPRGLVPVLVLDGAVHIESNDIIKVLERRCPEPELIPAKNKTEIFKALDTENSLHLDLRRLSFRFVYGRNKSPKSSECLASYVSGGSGTVQGKIDTHKNVEVEFYRRLNSDGLGDDACRNSALKFKAVFDDLDKRLENNPFILGPQISVLDIAWFVYAYRLCLGGYPLGQLHPQVNSWFENLCQKESFATEVTMSRELKERIDANRRIQIKQSKTMSHVAGFIDS